MDANSDAVSDEEVHRAIKHREDLISRTRTLVDIITQSENPRRVSGVVAREMVSLQKELRTAALRCVEKITAWTLSCTPPDAEQPLQFQWEGREYLCKMLMDLNFVCRDLQGSMQLHHHFEIE